MEIYALMFLIRQVGACLSRRKLVADESPYHSFHSGSARQTSKSLLEGKLLEWKQHVISAGRVGPQSIVELTWPASASPVTGMSTMQMPYLNAISAPSSVMVAAPAQLQFVANRARALFANPVTTRLITQIQSTPNISAVLSNVLLGVLLRMNSLPVGHVKSMKFVVREMGPWYLLLWEAPTTNGEELHR